MWPHAAHSVTTFLAKRKYQSGITPGPQSRSGSQQFQPLPRHEKGVEKEAFSDLNGHCKGFRGDSHVYGKKRLPECNPGMAPTLEKNASIAQ